MKRQKYHNIVSYYSFPLVDLDLEDFKTEDIQLKNERIKIEENYLILKEYEIKLRHKLTNEEYIHYIICVYKDRKKIYEFYILKNNEQKRITDIYVFSSEIYNSAALIEKVKEKVLNII